MSAPQKYRTRPVEITVMGPLTPENRDEIADWCNAEAKERMRPGPGRGVTKVVHFRMLKADFDASYGDYVVRTELGSFRCCPPEILAATYEAVSE